MPAQLARFEAQEKLRKACGGLVEEPPAAGAQAAAPAPQPQGGVPRRPSTPVSAWLGLCVLVGWRILVV
jgi:hypothetical protein